MSAADEKLYYFDADGAPLPEDTAFDDERVASQLRGKDGRDKAKAYEKQREANAELRKATEKKARDAAKENKQKQPEENKQPEQPAEGQGPEPAAPDGQGGPEPAEDDQVPAEGQQPL